MAAESALKNIDEIIKEERSQSQAEQLEIRSRFEDAWQAVATNPATRAVLVDLFDATRPEVSVVVSGDPIPTILHEGERRVWLHVQKRLLARGIDIHAHVRGR